MKKGILLLIIVIISVYSYSQKITVSEAQRVAENVITHKIFPLSQEIYKIDSYHTEIYNSTEAFYMFNLNPRGFILISATKLAEPLLAFSYESDYKNRQYNPAALQWIESYAKQIEYIIEKGIKPSEKIKNQWNYWLGNIENISKEETVSVAPMLNTRWDQGAYYNAHCPEDSEGTAGRAVTGCVATALAQLMNYFRYPSVGEGSYGYEHPVYGRLEVDFSRKSYDYDEMPFVLTDENEEVAELIYNIGVSVDMEYGPQSSGMTNHKGAYTLKTYFGYDSETRYLYKDSLPDDYDWKGTLVDHLNRKIPLYYAAWGDYNYESGHAFILDGYSDSSHYHINWGWGGYMDGYFLIDNLTPSGNNFTLAHEVIVNAFPALEPDYCDGLKTLETLEGTIEDGSGPLNSYKNDTECSWLIEPHGDTINGIKIEFVKFQIHSSDYITVYDGDSEESEVLAVFYGDDEPFELTGTSNKILIKFVTDGDYADDGWLLSYSSIRPEFCRGSIILTAAFDTISDGSGEYMYLNNSSCSWQIIPENAYNIRLKFLEFDLQEDIDIIRIYKSSGHLATTLSGSQIPEPLIIEGNKLTLRFTSDNTIRGYGFKFAYDINVNIADTISSDIYKTEKICIYPNPATDKLYINLKELSGRNTHINIINSNGAIIHREKIYLSSDILKEINISTYPQGLYLINITSDEEIYNSKFVKE